MEKGCSGGNTGILVNGRELHQKDLDVLSKRGLPTLRGRAYIIDIQGNITDMASGQRLKSLGKLAPTLVFLFLSLSLSLCLTSPLTWCYDLLCFCFHGSKF
jgi:hypothetical protein